MPTYHLAKFSTDITPPVGHPLCGGWIQSVRAVDDPLKLLGVVLLGCGKPIVLAAVDWTGVRNEAFLSWRRALADAAHTTPDHVALHCVHQHNAPLADTEAEKLIQEAGGTSSLNLKFFDKCLAESAMALKQSLASTVEFDRIGFGKGKVDKVASNRRVLGPDGKVKFVRTSSTKNPEARDAPEGLIDPDLRTLSFWHGDRPLAALHFYATHPMSYYGDGRVSTDFAGLARQMLQDRDPTIFQVYFNGCAGNITAGKYNDGAHANRVILRDRVFAGMTAAWNATTTHAVTGWTWKIEPVTFPPRREASFSEEVSLRELRDSTLTTARRNVAALQLAWIKRIQVPIDLTALDFAGKVQTLHLPGEAFIEYQIAATHRSGKIPICVASYGDDGIGYIPTESAFLEGGYEPTVALAAPESERLLRNAIDKLISQGK